MKEGGSRTHVANNFLFDERPNQSPMRSVIDGVSQTPPQRTIITEQPIISLPMPIRKEPRSTKPPGGPKAQTAPMPRREEPRRSEPPRVPKKPIMPRPIKLEPPNVDGSPRPRSVCRRFADSSHSSVLYSSREFASPSSSQSQIPISQSYSQFADDILNGGCVVPSTPMNSPERLAGPKPPGAPKEQTVPMPRDEEPRRSEPPRAPRKPIMPIPIKEEPPSVEGSSRPRLVCRRFDDPSDSSATYTTGF